MSAQSQNGELVITPRHSTSLWTRLMKRPPQNSPRRVYSSIATLGRGPDLQQRNWRNLDSRMSTILPVPTLHYFNLSSLGFSLFMKTVSCITSPSNVTSPGFDFWYFDIWSTLARSTFVILVFGALLW